MDATYVMLMCRNILYKFLTQGSRQAGSRGAVSVCLCPQLGEHPHTMHDALMADINSCQLQDLVVVISATTASEE